MNDAAAAFLREDCFWTFLDTGLAPERTPLLKGAFNDRPLPEVLHLRFGLTLDDAVFELSAARSELGL